MELEKRFANMKTPKGNSYERVIRSSITGSLATENVLEEDLNLDIKFAEAADDVDYKIDAWVETKDRNGGKVIIAIQLFSKGWENLTQEDKFFLSEVGMVQFFSETDLNKKWKKFAETKFANEIEKKINETEKGCLKYIQDHEKEIGEAKFVLMFATMPVGFDQKNPIVSDSGKLLDKRKRELFCEQFKAGFEEKVNK